MANKRVKDLYLKITDYFESAMPNVTTELVYGSPFQLLVAVVLSAQCTDKRVNSVTGRLFADYPTAEVMAQASEEVIYDYIKSVSYPNSKARHLVGLSRVLVEKHGGKVPSGHEDLVALPGVGRKTANVIRCVLWNVPAMPVDTHIFRVSRRLGLVPLTCKTPYSVECELVKNFPASVIANAHHWLLLHGRYVCRSRNPKCEECGLRILCKTYRERNE